MLGLLTLETYVVDGGARVYIRNYSLDDIYSALTSLDGMFYRNIIDASKYDDIANIISKAYNVKDVKLYDIRDEY